MTSSKWHNRGLVLAWAPGLILCNIFKDFKKVIKIPTARDLGFIHPNQRKIRRSYVYHVPNLSIIKT
ncbi:hypothetical protein PILCRDRAFT_603369 [Piloderma croceum F 1598]|uniref:Uncharacterized protein n=1 Tax=Piloderma croceum (strain F 1598) TaxID=765440 RepID=A0A0C3FE06_PILCF|nr:hypothetical protein PILCRDRAFT_603369 [Piloderma croceum F 1598]